MFGRRLAVAGVAPQMSSAFDEAVAQHQQTMEEVRNTVRKVSAERNGHGNPTSSNWHSSGTLGEARKILAASDCNCVPCRQLRLLLG